MELANATKESRDPDPNDNLGNLFEHQSDLVLKTTSLNSYLSVDQDLPIAEETPLIKIAVTDREGDSEEGRNKEERQESRKKKPCTTSRKAAGYLKKSLH